MKTLVKITAICALVLFSFSANAQIKVGGGLGLALPMGDFGDAFNMGFGLGVTGKYMLNDNMAAGLNIGFSTFSSKTDFFGVNVKFSTIPVTGLFHYYFMTEGFKPYAGADLGFYICKTKMDAYTSTFFGQTYTVPAVSDSETKIGFAPTVGCEYEINDKLSLDANLKYHYIMTEGDATTMVGINVGILYTIGK